MQQLHTFLTLAVQQLFPTDCLNEFYEATSAPHLQTLQFAKNSTSASVTILPCQKKSTSISVVLNIAEGQYVPNDSIMLSEGTPYIM